MIPSPYSGHFDEFDCSNLKFNSDYRRIRRTSHSLASERAVSVMVRMKDPSSNLPLMASEIRSMLQFALGDMTVEIRSIAAIRTTRRKPKLRLQPFSELVMTFGI